MAIPESWGDSPGTNDGAASSQRTIPSEAETQQEGRELFEQFVQQDLRRRGIQDPYSMIYNNAPNRQPQFSPRGDSPSYAAVLQHSNTVPNAYEARSELDARRVHGYSNPQWEVIGRNMNSLMEQFARSPHRVEVERLARTISIRDINEQAFLRFLTNYFTNGNNLQLKIIGLFFFCSDIIYRAIQDVAIDYGKRFMQWSLRFIVESLSSWVLASGGWGEVFKVHAPMIILSFLCGVLGMTTILFLSRWWSK